MKYFVQLKCFGDFLDDISKRIDFPFFIWAGKSRRSRMLVSCHNTCFTLYVCDVRWHFPTSGTFSFSTFASRSQIFFQFATHLLIHQKIGLKEKNTAEKCFWFILFSFGCCCILSNSINQRVLTQFLFNILPLKIKAANKLSKCV